MNERQAKLLCAIIDQFIETALPVGSKELLERHGTFLLSGATVRNEMRFLGEEGYLEQPHVSSGRVPTAKGYKMYVQKLMKPSDHERGVRERFLTLKEQYFRRKDQERVEEAVALLSHMIPNVVFATVPHKQRVSYLGLASILRQPEFQADQALATGVVEVVEDKLSDLLESIDIDRKIRSYIGGEHLLPQLQSCSMMVTCFSIRGEGGAIGILGPMRMDYSYNTVALEMVADLLKG